jgi:hypothetical protein
MTEEILSGKLFIRPRCRLEDNAVLKWTSNKDVKMRILESWDQWWDFVISMMNLQI